MRVPRYKLVPLGPETLPNGTVLHAARYAEVPRLFGQGATSEEAATSLRSLVEGHLERLKLAGQPIPQAEELGVVQIQVSSPGPTSPLSATGSPTATVRVTITEIIGAPGQGPAPTVTPAFCS